MNHLLILNTNTTIILGLHLFITDQPHFSYVPQGPVQQQPRLQSDTLALGKAQTEKKITPLTHRKQGSNDDSFSSSVLFLRHANTHTLLMSWFTCFVARPLLNRITTTRTNTKHIIDYRKPPLTSIPGNS